VTSRTAIHGPFGHLTPAECRALDGEAARVLAYARCLQFTRPDGRSLVARLAGDLGLAARTVEKALLRAQARGLLRLRRGVRGQFEVEPPPQAPPAPTANAGSRSGPATANVGSRSPGGTANVGSQYREPTFALSEKREEERDPDAAPPRPRGRRAGEVAPLEAFPEGRARDFAAAIREFDHPAWRADPKVTPVWAGRVLALAPGVDAARVARRAAAWWAEKPARTGRRASCTATLRTFLEREAETPGPAPHAGTPSEPRVTGAAERGRAEIEAARKEREAIAPSPLTGATA
jgi:hypothetical protein